MSYTKVTGGSPTTRNTKGATSAVSPGGSGHMPTSGVNRSPRFAGIAGSFKTTPRPAVKRNNPDNQFVKKHA